MNIRVICLKQVDPPLTGPAYQFITLWLIDPDGSNWSKREIQAADLNWLDPLQSELEVCLKQVLA